LLPARAPANAVLAQWHEEPAWADEVSRLRARGEIVVVQLPGHAQEHHEFICDRQLVRSGARWTVIEKS
jgi:ATP phosphoribosyltransferase regulatory subunit